MSKEFYRDIQIKKYCRDCRVEFRVRRGNTDIWQIRYCRVCRKIEWRKWYWTVGKPYFESLPEEERNRIKRRKYEIWLSWVVSNKKARRRQALESYHRRKHLHKARKHRKTKS